MMSEQEQNDARANRNARSAVEKVLFLCIAASLVACPIVLHLGRTQDLIDEKVLDIAGFYPERTIFGSRPKIIDLIMLIANASAAVYTAAYLLIMRKEVIRDRYLRQDRKNLCWVMCVFFYFLRLTIIWKSDDAANISVCVLILPALTLISISTALIGLSTVGGDARASEAR